MNQDTDVFADRNWPGWQIPSFVEVEGTRTAYRRDGAGEPMLYLHGGGGTRGWFGIHEQLAAHYDLIAPEHPGMGDSELNPEWDSWDDWVLHYDALLRQLGVERPHLVATSMGAWLAANLVITYPERFASLTLINPMGARIPEDPVYDIFRQSPESALDRLFNGRVEENLPLVAQQGPLEDQVHSYHENSVAALLMWNPRYDRKFDWRLSRVTIPTLVLAADDDRVVGNSQARRIAELIPGAEYEQLAGPNGHPSSHGSPIEQPAEVAARIHQHILSSKGAAK